MKCDEETCPLAATMMLTMDEKTHHLCSEHFNIYVNVAMTKRVVITCEAIKE